MQQSGAGDMALINVRFFLRLLCAVLLGAALVLLHASRLAYVVNGCAE